MSTSSAISSLQQALNCAGKCDCCDKLQQQINAINAKLNNIKPVDENALKTSIKSSLEPGIVSAVAGGVVVAVDRLNPKIQGMLNSITDINTKIKATENAVAEAARLKAISDLEARQKYNNLSTLEKEVRDGQYAKNLAAQGYNKAQVDKLLTDAELSRQLAERKAQDQFQREVQAAIKNQAAVDKAAFDRTVEGIAQKQRQAEEAARIAKLEAAKLEAAAQKAIADAARANAKGLEKLNLETKTLVGNVSNDVKALGKSLGSRIDDVGVSITRLGTRIGEVAATAGEAIGISRAAQTAIGELGGKFLRIAGRVGELFAIVGTFQVLAEQYFTLETLGGRIDAVESGVLALFSMIYWVTVVQI